MIFNDYALYYDLLYQDKDYDKETNYINSLIIKNTKKSKLRILDIGCGTGKHAKLLAKLGHYVIGVDFSEEMIKIAKKNKPKNTEFYQVDAVDYIFEEKFDIVLSLFHVLSYQNSNQNLFLFLRNASNHLNVGGLFIFDFWYGPAVLNIKPSIKFKKYESESLIVNRIADSKMNHRENIVNVNYNLMIIDKKNNNYFQINETHNMRYFFEPELNKYLFDSFFEILSFEEWLTSQKPTNNTWGICAIAKKIKNES
jgi:SAM-dependent methyltransferase